MPWTVIYYPKDGCPPSQGWSPTRRKCTTMIEFGTYIKLTKLIIGQNCHGWSPPIIPRMVTHQKEVYCRLRILQLNLTHKTNIRWQLPWMDSPSPGWPPTIARMVINHPKYGYQPFKRWSLIFQIMVPNDPQNGHPSSSEWSTRQGVWL